MKVIDVKCPHCGGEIHIGEDRRECFCEFCGSKLFIDDGVARQEVIIRDEAKIKELQIEEDRRRKIEEQLVELRSLQEVAKKRKTFDWVCIAGAVVFMLLWIIFAIMNTIPIGITACFGALGIIFWILAIIRLY